MKRIFTYVFVLTLSFATAQTTSDFENFQLDPSSKLIGDDLNGGFNSGNLFLPNTYFPSFGGWAEWAISNMTDTVTAGYTNDVSAIPFGGAEGTPTFAVAFGSGEIIAHLENDASGEIVNGLYLTNNSYAYISMRDGDGFAKKFGGLTGDDPDYFLLTIKSYLDGNISSDSVNFYLADFRFSDNSMDYIVKDWVYVDLTSLGATDSLSFRLSSSDVGMNGMNTPSYFCMDQFTTSDGTSSNSNLTQLEFKVFPNPTSDFILIKNEALENARLSIFSMNGKVLLEKNISDFQDQIDIRNYPTGSYFLKIQNEKGYFSQVLIKK